MKEDNNITLDLKYRPRRFEDVLGNIATVNLIRSLIFKGEFPRFTILSGPPGCGKTTTAFLIAKALQCKTYDGKGICGHCDSCIGIEETLYKNGKGNPSLGINTFDMGLNTDEEYLNDIALSIQSGSIYGKKIMIIEELQRTKRDAQDSLLNTLEFIPEDVYIIVTTSEVNKIVQALRTRAVEFKFNYPNSVELKNKIREIVEEELIKIKVSDIDLIIKQMNNNPRKILKSLETIKNSGEEGLEYLQELRSFDYDKYLEYFKVIQTSLMDTILFIEEIDDKVKFLQQMKFYIKDQITLRYAPSAIRMKKELRDNIINSLKEFSDEQLLLIMDDLTKVGYISDQDAGVKLLSISNKLNNHMFRTVDRSDDLKPDIDLEENIEKEIELISNNIKNTTGTINLGEL